MTGIVDSSLTPIDGIQQAVPGRQRIQAATIDLLDALVGNHGAQLVACCLKVHAIAAIVSD